jgi:hypothetical protein
MTPGLTPHLLTLALFSALLVVPAAPSRAEPDASVPSKPGKPAPVPVKPLVKTAASCTTVSGGVRAEAFGYKHVVTLQNGCDKPVECQVWTDVDPTPRQLLRAAVGETVEVVTRIGSPASVVTAHKECAFR